jgi:hypothetical protein
MRIPVAEDVQNEGDKREAIVNNPCADIERRHLVRSGASLKITRAISAAVSKQANVSTSSALFAIEKIAGASQRLRMVRFCGSKGFLANIDIAR